MLEGMMMAEADADRTQALLKQIRGHEVALAELNSLHLNRAVYQRNGNIYFRKDVKGAAAVEQRQLDFSKAQLQKL